MIYGVGINDAGYAITKNAYINGKQTRVWTCPFYQSWHSMLSRCYSALYQAKQTTYVGCSVVDEWHRFSFFREWMISQPWQGRQLDKDTLVIDNKIYGPDTCIFISQAMNLFLNSQSRRRGEWPLGVNQDKRDGKFQAECSNPFTGVTDRLGRFDCPDAAHEAWRKRKHQHALRYADMQDDPRIAMALRTRYLPQSNMEILP